MSKKNAIDKSIYIDKRYKEYIRSSFKFKSEELQKLFEQQIEKEDLFKGPYVDLSLPFQRGKCIDELIKEGVVCQSFRKLGDIDFERPLYFHQEESIRRICGGKSAIITTGTGSGKTESFLFPILNELMKDVENGNKEAGIRVIFLYPMNALVNDQMDRVRRILMKCQDITFGFYTGDTPEKVSEKYREKRGEELGTVIPENELVSREEIRNNPPHLLFTNYSMLEYLLIRPNDYSLFLPEHLNNWKFVVLDEAHTYHGALGIEISMLMRRLTGLVAKKPRFILTSATLGEQGKSESQIIDFARNLTSATFDTEDIIFSKRISLNQKLLQYTVDGKDYSEINESYNDLEKFNEIIKKYMDTSEKNQRECLYDWLCCDRNVYKIYSELKSGSKSFDVIFRSFSNYLSEKQLVDLIDLINKAEKNGIGLFDLKYHSFIRPLSGAYITLQNEPHLSLTKTNMLGEFKAFEIGNCRYCSASYIIGKIQYNEVDGIDYLYQNKEVDIYENYGNNEFVGIDYFLLENTINEEVDNEIIDEYKVCAKCGAIHAVANLNAHKCNCGTDFEYSIYKVLQNTKEGDNEAFNNIRQCPCCGHKGRSGVVKGLNLGKDEGTALIAQILFEAIDAGENQNKRKKKLLLKKEPNNEIVEEEVKVKQFLAFSDSRQQASFAATFFDSNHVRMLQKRLIWKVIEDNNFRDISVDELTAFLTSLIKELNLFDNGLSPHKNAWIATMVDLLKVDGSYDGEGLGLYYFDLDLSDIMSRVDEEDVKEIFGQYNINKSDLATMMQVVLSIFKTTPAISYVQSTLTPNEKMEALDYRRFDNYIMYNCPKTLKDTRSFLPVKGKNNMVVRYVQKVCECDESSAKDILDIIFNEIAVSGDLLKKHESKESYQIEASKYIVKNYKKSKYYICAKCGRLTPYNVHNRCIQDKCDGTLSEVDPDEVLASNFYRNQYKTKKIERIIVKEHTAQLDKKKAKKYQQDFKDGKINILSCSTTFEMGIDIGNLETVFMRNVPPSPANYVQRAGRAGRRKDSAAYILTYCGTSSHDYTYFCEPEKMISGVINPPYFNVINRKIIIRHLMATCLGYFFRFNPEYFRNIDGFVFKDGLDRFKEFVGSHPDDLNYYINEKILPEEIYKDYHDFCWYDKIHGNDEKMEQFVMTINSIAEELEKGKNEALVEENYSEADYYANQIEKLHNGRVIDYLSKYCVIPKYGFPVDVVDLQVYSDGKLDNSYDMNRDLRMAISEYAPDSEVIVDGKKYTSKYISLPNTGEYPRHYFCTCPNCQKINVFLSRNYLDGCKYCGESIASKQAEFFIEPVNGFKTGVTKESTRLKPKRSYSGEVSYLGGGIIDDKHLEFERLMIIETSSNDELLILNKSSFYMCLKCGYSDIAKERTLTPTILRKHKNFRQYDCNCEELTRIRLGHRFQTDVARFIIPRLLSYSKEDYERALSFMYAFLEGISIALEIERTDIEGVLEFNLERHSYDILIYDNVPGGAGHVKRLLDKGAVVSSIRAAYIKVSQNCCDENTSCYNCLRNYNNQVHHSKLKRKYAKEFIGDILREIDGIKKEKQENEICNSACK